MLEFRMRAAVSSSSHLGSAAPLLSRFNRLQSNDLKIVQEHAGTTFGSTLPQIDLESTGVPFNFVHNQLDLRRTSFHFLDYHCDDSAIRIEMPPMRSFFLLQFSLTGEAELSQDGQTHKVGPGHFKVVHGNSPLNGRLLPGYRSMILLISVEALAVELAEHIGRRPDKPLVFHSACYGNDEVGSALSSMTLSMCEHMDSGDPLFTREPILKRMEDLLMSLIVWSLPHNYSDELHEADVIVPYYVKRVETFMKRNARRAITFAELVRIADVSERTLQDGFRKYRHTTPMAFLKDLRLDLARETLQSCPNCSVTHAAFESGFNHLSKFAMEYRERFGERPSDTLRRFQLSKSLVV